MADRHSDRREEILLDNETMQVVPIGGLGEIGKNMTAVRQSSGMILVDAGMSFPDEEMPGIDLVLPDFTYLREHADELKGIVLTHGHEDHVGALPYLLREFNVPVYATRMTLGLVRSKLQEFGIKRGDLRELKAGDTQNLGGFGLEFIQVNHSIPGAVAIAIRTRAGLILFSGDYKIDLTPIEGAPMDLGRLAELGKVMDEAVEDEELERTKQQLKSSTLLALESTSARMNRVGRSVITGAELLTPEEISARIEAVTPEDISRLAKQHLRPEHMYLSAVGPKELDLGRYLN